MSEDEFKKIFSKKLKYYMNKYEKTQSDLVNDLGFNKSTVSTWINGVKIPRMDKIDALCNYFHIRRSDLLEDKDDYNEDSYYMNSDTREMAEFMFKNPEYKVLFDASRKTKPEDIQFVADMINRVNGNKSNAE